MHRRETERLLVAIRQAQAAPERVALATVVRVKGSAYRREGTRMLVRQNGTWVIRHTHTSARRQRQDP